MAWARGAGQCALGLKGEKAAELGRPAAPQESLGRKPLRACWSGPPLGDGPRGRRVYGHRGLGRPFERVGRGL
jgi:hypothetical protein